MDIKLGFFQVPDGVCSALYWVDEEYRYFRPLFRDNLTLPPSYKVSSTVWKIPITATHLYPQGININTTYATECKYGGDIAVAFHAFLQGRKRHQIFLGIDDAIEKFYAQKDLNLAHYLGMHDGMLSVSLTVYKHNGEYSEYSSYLHYVEIIGYTIELPHEFLSAVTPYLYKRLSNINSVILLPSFKVTIEVIIKLVLVLQHVIYKWRVEG